MLGLLADFNVQGHVAYLRQLLDGLDLLTLLADLNLKFATFADLQISPSLDDRQLWNLCQRDGWVLFTENRNRHDVDSLEATLADSWKVGDLPVLTLANKRRFEKDRVYANQVAMDIAEFLFGIAHQEYQPRIYVPSRGG